MIKFDDDNIEQIGDDEFIVVNYDEDTIYLVNHTDTIIGGQHIIVDTFIQRDTVFVEKVVYDKELQIIKEFLEKPDHAKTISGILILVFVAFSVWRKWNCKKTDK